MSGTLAEIDDIINNSIGKVLTAGEDLTNDVQKVEERFSYSFVTAPSLTVIKSGSGFIHTISINDPSSPTITLIDSATFPGSTIFFSPAGTPPQSYVLDSIFTTALSVVATNAGKAPQITLSYR